MTNWKRVLNYLFKKNEIVNKIVNNDNKIKR